MASDDLYFDMMKHPIDDFTAERLFDGALDPGDAPPGYAPVAALLQAAKGPTTADEVVRRDSDITAVAAVLQTHGAPKKAVETRHTSATRFGAKALVIAIPALALTATGAAAATGTLPTPAQSVVHSALAHVGVSLPSGSDPVVSNTRTIDARPTSNTNAVGPDATGSAKDGLCRAYIASNGHPNSHSVAFKNLEKAAGTAGVSSFCAGVSQGSGSSQSSTGSSDAGASDNGAQTSNSSSASKGSQSSKPASNKAATPAGPPASIPGSDHTSTSTPGSPPTSTPGSDHAPISTPAGPPASTPGSDHSSTSTPSGPPTSAPVGKP